MHPAPGVHISMAGCTILEGVHPVCARFLGHLLLLYIGMVHGTISGCTVLWEVHPASAQNKSLISDTVVFFFVMYSFIVSSHSDMITFHIKKQNWITFWCTCRFNQCVVWVYCRQVRTMGLVLY